jgi:hypothetical protein
VSSAGGIVTFTIRIDLNRLSGGESRLASEQWHGKDSGSEQEGESISKFFRADTFSESD